ncbi:MAG: hypothetical protein JST40_05200 [Armatimonadetes bacterium]|nr:hypothetical protein [Armatimonadota bacterium]
MEHQFAKEDRLIGSDEELRELLERLENRTGEFTHEFTTEKPCITVEDVAEALGLGADEVARVLRQLHEEHREARITGVFKELEEPLYRVERPDVRGHLTDPIFRLRSVQLLMERNRPKAILARKAVVDHDEIRGHRVGQVVLWALLLLAGILLIGGTLHALTR